MFYHDHAYGITRLNVYVGEAAGYLLYDPTEEAALANAGAPGSLTAGDLTHLIPLVIQDKTFVPSPAQIGMTDPTWAAFGTTPGTANSGDLWFPHVYMPNQNSPVPSQIDAATPASRSQIATLPTSASSTRTRTIRWAAQADLAIGTTVHGSSRRRRALRLVLAVR